MKKLGFLRIGLSFAGCFLGAGYVSGQELWQFFGRFGTSGVFGLVFALLFLGATGYVTLRMTLITGEIETDRLIAGNGVPVLRWAISALEAVFLFGVCVIMTAGVGALCSQLLHIPAWIGCAGFALLITVIALTGLQGMVHAFSATVPILVFATLCFGLRFAIRGDYVVSSVQDTGSSGALVMFWPFSALTFACYNVFGSIAILSPLGKHIKSPRSILGGMVLGVIILLSVALSVLISVFAAGTQNAELPMLTMALEISYPAGLIYGFLLFLAMFGTGLSCLVTFLRAVGEKFAAVNTHKNGFLLFCGIVIFAGSLLGFGDLISVVYPIIGYCSIAFIVLLFIRYFRLKKKNIS